MTKRNTTLSIAAVLAASALALQAPIAGAQDNSAASSGSATTSQSANSQQGVPGVEVNVGQNASDRGLPGVEANIGAQGDQNNMDTRTLGASGDSTIDAETSDSTLSPRADRG